MSILLQKKEVSLSKHQASGLLNKNEVLKTFDSFSKGKFEINRDLIFSIKHSKRKDFDIGLTSLESLPLIKIRSLQIGLKMYLNPRNKSKDSYKKYLNMSNLINDFLNSEKYPCYLENDRLYRVRAYGYSYGGRIGRLYSLGKGFQNIPKLFRSFLLNGDYVDVDLVNSHPTILAEYSIDKDLPNKVLCELVSNREDFYKSISEELGYKSGLNPKKATLIVLNSLGYSGKSKKLLELSREVASIRESIWEDFYINNNSNINIFNNKSIFHKRNLHKQKIHVQSLFCHTKETELLLGLHKFISDKLLSEGVTNLREKMHFIPFFDGALIYFENKTFLRDISEWVDYYNENHLKLNRFKIKDIENLLTDSELNYFNCCEMILKVLSTMYRTDIESLKEVLSVLTDGEYSTIFNEEELQDIVKSASKTKRVHETTKKELEELFKTKKKIKNSEPKDNCKLGEINKEIDMLMEKSRKTKYYYLTQDQRDLIYHKSMFFVGYIYDCFFDIKEINDIKGIDEVNKFKQFLKDLRGRQERPKSATPDQPNTAHNQEDNVPSPK